MVHPEQFPFYPECVPRELKEGRFWVCCDAKKVPMVPGSMFGASSTNPATWRTYQEAVAAVHSDRWPGRYAGVGRVITNDDPYVGVDLDGVRDPATGVITDEARDILEELNSYSEVSPSGEGVKVWVEARLDRSYVNPGIEIYQRGRYFVVTGQILPQYPLPIRERQVQVEALVKQEFPQPRPHGVESYDGPEVEIADYLAHVEVFAELRDGLGIKYAIRCPWVHEHSDQDESGTYIGQVNGGGLWFRCWHAHCHERKWAEFRLAVCGRVVKIARPSFASNPTNERMVNITRE